MLCQNQVFETVKKYPVLSGHHSLFSVHLLFRLDFLHSFAGFFCNKNTTMHKNYLMFTIHCLCSPANGSLIAPITLTYLIFFSLLFWISSLSLLQGIPCFFDRFFSSGNSRGLEERKILVFFVVFLAFFQKSKGKKIRVRREKCNFAKFDPGLLICVRPIGGAPEPLSGNFSYSWH